MNRVISVYLLYFRNRVRQLVNKFLKQIFYNYTSQFVQSSILMASVDDAVSASY